jgi:hypothetical protein
MRRDFRSGLRPAEFDAIPINEEYPIDDYYDRLIARNETFRGIDREFPGGFTDNKLVQQLTPGQRLLIFAGGFDGEVKNGGITQFFWNCPDWVFEVRDAFEFLGPQELLQLYERAVQTLIGNKDRWLALREQCYSRPEGPDWEPFRKTYDLLDLDWFEHAYFDKRGYNNRGEWDVQERGLNHALLTRLADYVRSHRSEFIQE